MSNVKNVVIKGILPFNAHEHSSDISSLYSQLNQPVFGLRLKWTGSAGSVSNKYIDPAANDGLTALIFFEISGQEAVSFSWLDWVHQSIANAHGQITHSAADDAEADLD